MSVAGHSQRSRWSSVPVLLCASISHCRVGLSGVSGQEPLGPVDGHWTGNISSSQRQMVWHVCVG